MKSWKWFRRRQKMKRIPIRLRCWLSGGHQWRPDLNKAWVGPAGGVADEFELLGYSRQCSKCFASQRTDEKGNPLAR